MAVKNLSNNYLSPVYKISREQSNHGFLFIHELQLFITRSRRPVRIRVMTIYQAKDTKTENLLVNFLECLWQNEINF